MLLINFLVTLYVTGVATNWQEEVRDSLVPPATVPRSFAQGNQLPYPLRLDSLLGIRVGGHFFLSLSLSLLTQTIILTEPYLCALGEKLHVS